MMTELIARHWMTLHGLAVLLGLTIYIVGSRTLLQRRRPSAAIAWVISLAVMPYVALPLYLVFGNRKIVDPRQPAERPSPATPIPESSNMPGSHARQLAAAMGLPPPVTYRNLNVHRDGGQALRRLHAVIDAATRTLDLCTFLFGKDRLGAEIAQRLERRARDGVQVRLMIDGIGAYLGGRPDFRRLSAAGVQTALFVPPLRSSVRGRTNLRNHRKMAIADGDWLWCGGRNLASEYFRDDPNASRRSKLWVDLSFDLRGPLALQAQALFERDWAFATQGSRPEPARRPGKEDPRAPLAQLVASGPDQVDDTIYTLLVSGSFASRKRILAVTPYFVPDGTLLMSLTLAARRGVAVDLVMPRKSNHRLADLARHRALRELTEAGARVWFLPRMIHAKAVVIDDELALAGSANLDERSLFLNYELMVAFYARADIERFAAWIEGQRGLCSVYHARPPRLMRDVAEGLLLWIGYQL